jgi:hypothetical protein
MSTYDRNELPAKSIVGFLGLFAVMIAIAIAKKTGAIDYDLAKRGVGIIFGLMLIGAGNLLPKFRLFDVAQLDRVKALAVERFAGWVFVLGGIAYVAVWALAPMPSAMLISSIVGLAAFALVAVDFIRRASGARTSVATPQATDATLVKQTLLGMLLLSLGWGVTIFLVDYIWGDAVSQWVAVIWSISFVFVSMHLLASRPPLEK